MIEANLPDFESLESLKTYLDSIRRSHASTLRHYLSEDAAGFYHHPSRPKTASRSSTATCVSSLIRTGHWDITKNDWLPKIERVASQLIHKPWRSAKLRPNNPFSVAFIIEGILDLRTIDPNYRLSKRHMALITVDMSEILLREISDGAIKIDPYPNSAYLTQLVYRVLSRLDVVPKELRSAVQEWARQETHRHIALISTGSRTADPLNLAYALILLSMTATGDEVRPEDKHLFAHALETFFQCQGDDGKWPLSQPLFHYPEVGNAYCFEYEALTQLLQIPALRSGLLPHIPKMAKAAYALETTSFDLDLSQPGTVVAWASGHHPQIQGPESWSTASVYHFAHALDRLVAEAIRRVVFSEMGRVYRPPARAESDRAKFAADFLDAELVDSNDRSASLRQTLADRFVLPIATAAENVEKGLGLERPMSAIFYGPPGTSKTDLAEHIGNYLGWPLLAVDPSYVVSQGLDKIQSQANRLFKMIEVMEQVVVLLDEFDEMGRDRSRSENLLSRFITTSMLPKLISINKAKKIVFLLATNYIGGFDAAFSRGGRFDMLVQIMPPTYDEKARKWPGLAKSIMQFSQQERDHLKPKIADLTFSECSALNKALANAHTKESVAAAINDAWNACTLCKLNDGSMGDKPHFHKDKVDYRGRPTLLVLERNKTPPRKTWKDTCNDERRYLRLPP